MCLENEMSHKEKGTFINKIRTSNQAFFKLNLWWIYLINRKMSFWLWTKWLCTIVKDVYWMNTWLKKNSFRKNRFMSLDSSWVSRITFCPIAQWCWFCLGHLKSQWLSWMDNGCGVLMGKTLLQTVPFLSVQLLPSSFFWHLKKKKKKDTRMSHYVLYWVW